MSVVLDEAGKWRSEREVGNFEGLGRGGRGGADGGCGEVGGCTVVWESSSCTVASAELSCMFYEDVFTLIQVCAVEWR